jgi:hypothetical protein
MFLFLSEDSGSLVGLIELFGNTFWDPNLLSEGWVVSGRRHSAGLLG